MRISNKIDLFALFIVFLFFSCKEEGDPYSNLHFKCGNLFADTTWDAYIEECGGCDIDTREFNSMCFQPSTSGFYLFDWPDGCRQGTKVLMVLRGAGEYLDVEFFNPNPPKRPFIDGLFGAWVYPGFTDQYQIRPTSEKKLSDSCITNQTLIPVITFDKKAFRLPRFHEEMPGEFIWVTERGEEFKRSEVTFHLQELPEVRKRYDE
jgi:hypothetical protein